MVYICQKDLIPWATYFIGSSPRTGGDTACFFGVNFMVSAILSVISVHRDPVAFAVTYRKGWMASGST